MVPLDRGQRFRIGSNITNARRQAIAQKVHSGGSPNMDLEPVEMVGSTFVAFSEGEQFTLRIWQTAFRGDASEPSR
jgi:hypothetical protein